MENKISNTRLARPATPRRTGRAAAAVGTVAAALALVGAAATGPAFAEGAGSDPDILSAVDYSDCPQDLPAGVDRAAWRCEVTVAYGHITLGGIDMPDIKPITLVHAEGPLADGTFGQVFGSLRAEPTPVPGGLLGGTKGRSPVLGLAVQPEYGGYSDFLGTATNKGALGMKFRLVSPLLGRGCTIGTDTNPVDLHLKKAGPSTWLSQNPPLVKFEAYDNTFTTPQATGCGPLGQLVNRRNALPAGSGANHLSYTAYYTFKTYDQLPAA
ncbi:hypothetical protein ACT1U9_00265 [Streptomyces sp. BR1]|uniref:hypothetical protein n=1 Tax=Streptomyces sp. BR1 TaxID=1592323 RepID=UPI00402B9ACB